MDADTALDQIVTEAEGVLGGELDADSRSEIADILKTALRTAVVAERERCAALADQVGAVYETAEPNPGPEGGKIVACRALGDLIREVPA